MKNKSKVKLFTDTDLDGVGANILGKLSFSNISISNCEPHNINEKVINFIETEEIYHYDRVYFTDISLSKEVAEKISFICQKDEIELKLFDHHQTANWMNCFKWAYVTNKILETNVCGTSLFYKYLISNNLITATPILNDFVELVRLYDTWDWTRVNENIGKRAKNLNDLFYIYGAKRFVDIFIQKISNEQLFSKTDDLLLEFEKEKMEKYIKSRKIIKTTFQNYNVVVIFAELYYTDISFFARENYPYLDFLMIVNINNKTVSFRGLNESVDLSLIAEQFNGGGHHDAAGSKFTNEIKNIFINNNIF